MQNTSLVLTHCLKCRTACKIQNGRQGALKWPTGSGKVSTIGVTLARFGQTRHSIYLDAITFDQPNYRQSVVEASDYFRVRCVSLFTCLYTRQTAT